MKTSVLHITIHKNFTHGGSEMITKYKCICGGYYVERTNRCTGNKFLGCSNFPSCKRTMNKVVVSYIKPERVEFNPAEAALKRKMANIAHSREEKRSKRSTYMRNTAPRPKY